MSANRIVTELVADDKSYGQAIERAVATNLKYQSSAERTISSNRKLGKEFNSAGKSVSDIEGPLTSVTRKIEGYTSAISGMGLAVGGVATGAVAAVQRVASSAVELDNLSRVAGMTVEDFQAAAHATDQFGISAEKLADISKDAQDKIGDFIATGGGEFKDFFENIAPKVGLTAQELQNLSGPEVLGAIKKALDDTNTSMGEQIFYLEALANDTSLLYPLLDNNSKKLKEQVADYKALGIAMTSIDIQTMREADQQLRIISETFSKTFAKAVVDSTTAVTELANSQQAAEVASLAMFVAAGRVTGAITSKTAATYKDVQATIASEKADISRLAIDAKAAKSQEVAARAALAQAQKQTQGYGMLSRSARDAAAAKQALIAAQHQVTATTLQATTAQNALTAAQQRSTVAAKAMTVAGRALSGSLALVGGPVGAAMMVVGALGYLVTRSGDAAAANRNLADSTEELTEKLDTLSTKQLKVARLDASASVRQLEADLKQLGRDIEDTPTTITISAYTTGDEKMETVYQAGIDKVTRLEAKQEDLNDKLANTRTYLREIDDALNPEEKPKKKPKEPTATGTADAYDPLADLQKELDALRLGYASKEQILLDNTLAEQEILINAQNNRLISEQEAQQLSKESWDQYYAEVSQLAQTNADTTVEIERNAAMSMLDNITGSLETSDQIAQTFSNGLSQSLAQACMSGELSFESMANSIINQMLQMMIQAQIVGPMMQAMGLGGGTAGAGATPAATATVGVNHTGGIAGIADASSRTVPISTFAGAPRFHTGGIVGSEVPIIAQRGEGVFTREQMANMAPANNAGAKVSIQLINNGTQQEVERTEQTQNGDTTQIKMWIRDVINSDLNSGQGIDRTLRTQYPSLSRRGYG